MTGHIAVHNLTLTLNVDLFKVRIISGNRLVILSYLTVTLTLQMTFLFKVGIISGNRLVTMPYMTVTLTLMLTYWKLRQSSRLISYQVDLYQGHIMTRIRLLPWPIGWPFSMVKHTLKTDISCSAVALLLLILPFHQGIMSICSPEISWTLSFWKRKYMVSGTNMLLTGLNVKVYLESSIRPCICLTV